MKRFILDIETTSSLDKIHCCVTKDMDTGEVVCHTEKETLLNLLNQDVKLVGANLIAFDCYLLNKLWGTKITLKMVLMDTLVLSRLLNPIRDGGHSLNAWGKRVGRAKIDYKEAWENATGRKVTKAEQFDEPVFDILYDYCKGDVEVTEKVYYALLKEQNDTGTKEEAVQLEYQVQSIISIQERNGFKLNLPYAMQLLSEIKGKMSVIDSQMEATFPTIVRERFSEKTGKQLKDEVIKFNPGSRKQIFERLSEKYGWKPKKMTDKGTPIVDEAVLAELKYPEAKFLADYFMLQKRASMLESWLEKVGKDGRVHGKVITIGAVTGRCTHSDPNMAQVPAVRAEYGKEFRSCWVVDTGNVLVGTDLSGIELRCFAHYLNDPDYTNEVVNGDVHTRNQHAFGVDSRDLAKTILYATLYGASAGKVGRIIGKGDKDGKCIIDNFSKAVPAYKKLKEKVERLSEKGSLPGLDGRRVVVRSAHSALNTLLQSAGAIIFKKWLIITRTRLREARIPYRLVATVHDEQEIEVAEEYAEQVAKITVAAAKEAGEVLGFRCPVDAEAKIGKSWCEVH